MSYRLVVGDSAIKDLAKLDKQLRRRFIDRLEALAGLGEEARHIALSGPLSGSFKLRVGDHRAIYRIDRQKRELRVDKVKHRSQVYKDLG